MKMYTKYLDKLESLEDKVAIVTGANSGLGFQTALALAYKGARVIMACRNLEKAEIAKNKIIELVPNAKIDICKYDQGSFNSIEKFSIYIEENYQHIDCLVCNAGVYFPKVNYRTKDNLELTMGTNYFGTYHLLKKMNPMLERCHSKVIVVTSLTAFLSNKSIDLKDFEKMSRNKNYGYSKCCLSRLTYELSTKDTNVTYYLTHPGICQTNIISSDQTGLPSWFSKLGHLFLYVFVHHASKACLTNIKAIYSLDKDKNYIKPRGPFAISGYPKAKKMPNFVKDPIIEETEEYLRNTIKL